MPLGSRPKSVIGGSTIGLGRGGIALMVTAGNLIGGGFQAMY